MQFFVLYCILHAQFKTIQEVILKLSLDNDSSVER